MGRSSALTALLVLTVITVTRGQYYDILQGLQQLFQPYQGNNFNNQYNGFTRTPTTHKQTNRQEIKKKNNEQRHQNEERRTKKPSVNQYDYVFATTEKPSRKTTKSNSSHPLSNYRNLTNKNQYSNILLGDNPYEVTTKSNKVNRVKTTTTTTEANYYNNYFNNPDVHRATTENVIRPVTESLFENVNNPINYQQLGNIYENQNNRRPANLINNAPSTEFNNNNPNNRVYPQIINNNQNNNRGILNTDYNIPNLSTNNRNPNVFGTNNPINRGSTNNRGNPNNFGTTNNAFLNTDINPSNFGTNTGLNNNNNNNRVLPNHRAPNEFDNRGTNSFGNTGIQYNNRGISNINTNNNRGTPTQINTNNWGNTNNQGNSNYDPKRVTFLYPSDTPLINRPGVKPAPVDTAQPPITNRPVPDRSNFLNQNRPSEPSSVTFSGQPDAEPEILIGPDEDDMSERQKRRYVELAERMCDRYKSLTVRKVVALPLVPSPDPVELNVSDCTPINVPLVIGGKVVSIRDFPHMALVGWMKTRNAGYSWKCGGSLISNQYVLTAGHCTYQDKDYDVVSGPPQAVQLGSSYLDDPGALVVKISSVIRHPKYKQRRSYHDIALIKMASKVTFSEVIRPACLGVPPPEGSSIIATGWGRTEFGGDHSSELRSVSLRVWNMEECREIWGTSLKLPNGVTTDSHMCAGEKAGGKDTCQGDSGGPAQVQDGCLWRVIAVTSFGRSCGAPHTPALYAVIPRAFVAAQVFADQNS